MKLFEHPDFEQAIIRAAEYFVGQGLRPAIIEKDYFDLFQLSRRPEVLAMLQAEEYSQIKRDYDTISRAHFPKSYFCPDGMSFAKSDAFFPSKELGALLGAEYERQCGVLCYGPYPSWAKVQARFEKSGHCYSPGQERLQYTSAWHRSTWS